MRYIVIMLFMVGCTSKTEQQHNKEKKELLKQAECMCAQKGGLKTSQLRARDTDDDYMYITCKTGDQLMTVDPRIQCYE